MKITKYLNNNAIFIVPDIFKDKMVKIVNSEPLLNIKIITLSELKRKLIFDYDERTILYLMNEKELSYKNSIEYLDSLYYLTEKNDSCKLKELALIKKELDKEKLLIYDEHFLNFLNNKNVYVYGFDYLFKFDKYLINKINNVTQIEEDITFYNNSVLSFNNINEEIEFIANDIINKSKIGIEFNNIFIANYNKDYELTIKRIFDFYNIPVNLKNNNTLYKTSAGIKVLNNLENYSEVLKEINDNNIYNAIIDIFNKYYFIDDYSLIKDVLTEEFKKKKINDFSLKSAVNLTNIFDNKFSCGDHIYLIGFNNEHIPVIYKDEDFINDKEKNILIESTKEKNFIEKNRWINVIKTTQNLTLTYSLLGINGSLRPSPLIDNFKNDKGTYKVSNYSNSSNRFNLAIFYDDLIKYGNINLELPKLHYNYKITNYPTYDNRYKQINNELIKKRFKDGLYLSYTKLNTYYECSFKYYLDNVLKISKFEESFEAYLGSLCHHILSKIYDGDFNFDYAKEEFIKNNEFKLTAENNVFMDKMMEELKFSISYLKEHYDETMFKDVECEREVVVQLDYSLPVILTGFIDKIMKLDNQVAVIDYKTFITNIDLSLAHHGLKVQLPIYIYLLKKAIPDSLIVGMYLQSISRNIINYNPKKTIEEVKKEELKLIGYTINEEDKIALFDPSYSKSKFIKSMSLTNSGFYHYAKILSNDDFEALDKLAEKLIENCATGILNADFDINPKILDKTNLSCNYCKYKSICFVNYDNYKFIDADKELTFLRGDNHD